MFKPLFDSLFALILLILLSPIIFCTSILLTFYNRGTPLFIQKRPGYRARPFYIIKFKTMRDAFDAQGNPLSDAERITPFGQKVRGWSLDEWLQLANVLKGDMSFVGPRPLLMQYLSLYNKEQARRHEVKPGITGWAQVNGRNAISWPQKFALDVEYVERQSFWFDVTILLLTVKKVFQRANINAEGSATIEPFKGNS